MGGRGSHPSTQAPQAAAHAMAHAKHATASFAEASAKGKAQACFEVRAEAKANGAQYTCLTGHALPAVVVHFSRGG